MAIKIEYQSRKLLVMLLLTAIAVLALMTGKAQFSEMTTFLEWIYITYASANIADKITTKNKQAS
jgi:type IV secretory pathway VirB2 component (pilin)